jgi:flotillin
MLEHMDGLAQASAKAVSNIKFNKVVVWEGGGANGSSNTANFLQNMARVMPPMLQVMKDVSGVEVPEYLAKLTGDGSSTAAATPATNGQAGHHSPKTV